VIRRLIDPFGILQYTTHLLQEFAETYLTLTREADMHTANILCPCGNEWTYRQPDHYGGEARYPQRCLVCDGAGEVLKKVSNR
jgi:hypothetical protein